MGRRYGDFPSSGHARCKTLQLFEFTLPQPSVGIPMNALEEQREPLRNRHPGASGRNSQRSSCFLYFRGFKSIVISWIRWLHKNIDPCGSHITLPPASKKASRSSSMSEAQFAFALSRGYTQIDYFLAISFRSSILACVFLNFDVHEVFPFIIRVRGYWLFVQINFGLPRSFFRIQVSIYVEHEEEIH